MIRLCTCCNEPIPAERLEALPETQTCVQHSSVQKKICLIQGAGHLGSTKDYSMEIFDADNTQAISRHRSRKGRSWGSGVGSSDQRSQAYWRGKQK